MDKPESSCAILSKLKLDDIEKVVNEAYPKDGPGNRPGTEALKLENLATSSTCTLFLKREGTASAPECYTN